MNDAARVCSRLIEFEERSSSLYLRLARRFANHTGLSWFFLEMGMQEKQHAVLLEFCGCEGLVPGDLPGEAAIQKLSDLLQDLEARASRRDLTIDEAFLIAGELEASELSGLYTRLVASIQGTDYIIRKKIETLIPDHMQSLLDGAEKFGVSEPVMVRLLELNGRRTEMGG
jgi:hypothetical protein